MDNDAGMTAIGVGGIGFGILLIYSAYKNQSLFGKDGIIPTLIDTGKLGQTVGEKAGSVIPPRATGIASNPPGYGGGPWTDV